ncbi:MAG TPA: ice-binding family protein, partial [Dehalococcoidia bacterium]|nr:ice-binding family protein [Dehalococcoidia bacterium]
MFRLSKRSIRAGVVGLASSLGLVVSVMVLAGSYPGGGEASNLQATAPGLGAAQSFAVLAAAGITNTGPTTVTGDLGTHPTAAITGFFGTTANDGPGTVTGQIHQTDGTALSARTALTGAYNNAAGSVPVTIVGTELGGQNLVPGTYASASGTFGITGTLTLNGGANDVWVFKTASTLITAGSSTVSL